MKKTDGELETGSTEDVVDKETEAGLKKDPDLRKSKDIMERQKTALVKITELKLMVKEKATTYSLATGASEKNELGDEIRAAMDMVETAMKKVAKDARLLNKTVCAKPLAKDVCKAMWEVQKAEKNKRLTASPWLFIRPSEERRRRRRRLLGEN